MLTTRAVIMASCLASLAVAKPTVQVFQVKGYPICGYVNDTSHECETQSLCMDDPRDPPSCGLDCGVPGICIPRSAGVCKTGHETCPKEQKCFGDLRHKECKANGCPGLCLYPKEVSA
jgi:hypothetical protein